jgi:hypothetical protein
MQVAYATDLLFHRQADLRPLYETLVRTAIHAVKPDHVATFLGRKLTGNYADDLGNDFHTRLEGTRLKHHLGPVAIKLYDKQALVLRIETTVNDVSFFRHHRTVEHRDGTPETKLAPMRRTIYSLGPLRDLLVAANRRYLAFLSDLSDPSGGVQQIAQVAEPTRQDDRSYRGFNLFSVVAFERWGHIFGDDDVIAAATLDRLLHFSEVFAIDGPSYRLRGKVPPTMTAPR